MSNQAIATTRSQPDTAQRGCRVLGLFAHPDDETFCAAGAFARYAERDAEIMVVSATRGEAGQIRDAEAGSRKPFLGQAGRALGPS